MSKVFITDLDGTLLDSRGSLSDFSRNSLRELLKRDDFNFTVATGRDFYLMRSPLRGFNFKIPLISHDGAYVTSVDQSRPLYVENISWDCVDDIYSCFKHNGFSVFFKVIQKGEVFNVYDGINNFLEHWYLTFKQTYCRSNIVKIDKLSDISLYDVLSVTIIATRERIEDIFLNMKSYSELKVSKYGRVEFNDKISVIEIQSVRAEKINGIKFLADYLSISYKDIVYFGDSDNDISVFNENEIHKVTPQNGIDALKDKACEVIDYHYNDAVLKYILNNFE
ncbi:HAD-IIB family hydrolase [Borrelia sp. RT5S]|uniref:HAD-IIB family hydrolase n=1 Tax=Borrelia sp. RT5S TaxID=2898581 RepID=UPI001E53F55A|nr:HAD family hydrolase [Borrelia sp. RT5S]UGQ15901.1 Cof-type HAD-IIB family hydrolase [Borrelia sp. RT5S]